MLIANTAFTIARLECSAPSLNRIRITGPFQFKMGMGKFTGRGTDISRFFAWYRFDHYGSNLRATIVQCVCRVHQRALITKTKKVDANITKRGFKIGMFHPAIRAQKDDRFGRLKRACFRRLRFRIKRQRTDDSDQGNPYCSCNDPKRFLTHLILFSAALFTVDLLACRGLAYD